MESPIEFGDVDFDGTRVTATYQRGDDLFYILASDATGTLEVIRCKRYDADDQPGAQTEYSLSEGESLVKVQLP